MDPVFAFAGLLMVASAVAAMALRHLVHCALCLVLTFAALAVLYLRLGAEFVGLAQVLVYVGAVGILIVFAILLTRAAGPGGEPRSAGGWPVGLGIAALTAGTLGVAVLASGALTTAVRAQPEVTVRQLGEHLMTRYVLPLQVMGLLLTVALIGAVLLAMRDEDAPRPDGKEAGPR